MKIIAVDFQFKQCEWQMLKTYDMQLHYNMNEWMKIIAVDFQFKQCEWWMLKTYRHAVTL